MLGRLMNLPDEQSTPRGASLLEHQVVELAITAALPRDPRRRHPCRPGAAPEERPLASHLIQGGQQPIDLLVGRFPVAKRVDVLDT
jgi:hypothetical protein